MRREPHPCEPVRYRGSHELMALAHVRMLRYAVGLSEPGVSAGLEGWIGPLC